jgi:hypothetical protein
MRVESAGAEAGVEGASDTFVAADQAVWHSTQHQPSALATPSAAAIGCDN